MPPSGVLRADAVSFSYGAAPVLHEVTIDAAGGRCLGILGPNGCGKTTLLHLLAGLLEPSSGSVRLGGRPLSGLTRAAVARRLALVPQDTHLAFEYSVIEIALMGRYPHLAALSIEGPDDVATARAALGATGSDHLAGRPFSSLSGGEKQRVIIASALAQLMPVAAPGAAPACAGGSVLLLDEPTASLDLRYQLEVAAVLRTLRERSALTMLVSTHDLNFAASLCDHLVLLRDGRVIADGPTDAVLTAGTVRALYDVEVDVRRHDAAGHLTVVPIGRAPADARPPLAG